MLRKMLRLLTIAVLFAGGSAVAVSAPAGADETPPVPGVDYRTLIVLCDQFRGDFIEDKDERLPAPYRYGCVVTDGQIECLETTDCIFVIAADYLERPPFEETCQRWGGKFQRLLETIYGCDGEDDDIYVNCSHSNECQLTVMENEQPMPWKGTWP